MDSLQPLNDTEFIASIKEIKDTIFLTPYMDDIFDSIIHKDFNKVTLNQILEDHSIESVSVIKEDALDFLLAYINSVLDDDIITEKELIVVRILKRIFKIKEGDFYKLRASAVKGTLNRQFKKLYEDNIIDRHEAILKVGLQELFDLGYDQFLEFSEGEVRAALQRGANLDDLDTFIMIKKR